MKIFCSKNELVDAISIVQKAITGKATLPILDGILIKCINNKLTLTATDLDLGIETSIFCQILSEGSVVLNSKLLGDIIRKLPDDNISIEVDNNTYNTKIISGKSKFNLVGKNPYEYPDLPNINENIMYNISQNIFRNAIKQVIFATAQDETRPILTGVLFEVKDGVLNMVALDAYRLALKKSKIESNNIIKAVIPGKTLNEISKILVQTDENISITFTPNHILFTFDNTKIISRLLDGEFINYNQIIPQECKLKVKVKTKELLESIERASLLAKEGNNNLIKMDISNNNLIITSNSQLGNVYEEIQVEADGNDIQIAFNSKYFIDVLKIIEAEDIYLELTSSITPCILKNAEDNDYTYLVLPVRLITQ